ncbi:MAG: hypothetical protein ACKOZW_13960 [Cyanobium sp.]
MSDSGEGQAQARRAAQAASVSRPWWEPGTVAPGPAPEVSSALAVRSPRELELERELEAARAEVQALHEMLEDLPEIFERKFRQRVQSLVGDQQRLLADNQMLRDRLYALTPAPPTVRRGSIAALPGRGASEPERKGLGHAVREALGGLRGPGAGRQSPPPLTDRDDGRTTAA